MSRMKKYLKIFIFVFVLLLVPNSVFAEEISDNFKQILNDENKLIITETTTDDKLELINSVIRKIELVDNTKFFTASECNEDYTSCNIKYGSFDFTDEEHWVDVVWNEIKSQEFLDVIGDKITITSNSLDKSTLVSIFSNSLEESNYQIQYNGCNSDYTACTFEIMDRTTWKSEKHVTSIEYIEEFSDEFKLITEDNRISFPTIRPKDPMEADFFLNSYLSKYYDDNTEVYVGTCSDDFSKCDLVLQKHVDNHYEQEIHVITASYATVEEKKATAVNNVLASLPEDKTFIVEDLEFINFIVNSGIADDNNSNFESAFINYSGDLKNTLGNKNITAELDVRGGDPGSLFYYENIGGYSVKYDGVTYGVFHGGSALKYVLYIPDDTINTSQAYIEAAMERINEYLGNNELSITVAGELTDLDISDYEQLNLGSKIGDYYYCLTYKDLMVAFLIAKDSSKMKSIEPLVTSDIMTDISISTDSTSVPLDTTIQATQITSGDEYEAMLQVLNIKDEDNLTYDLKLYSGSSNKYITKLNDGKFQVKIPISENLKGKKLVAYYVDENGKPEVFEVDPVDGYAVFETTHFSIYTLAEAKEVEDNNINNENNNTTDNNGSSNGIVSDEKVPATFDGITNYIFIGLIGLIGLGSCVVFIKKENYDK